MTNRFVGVLTVLMLCSFHRPIAGQERVTPAVWVDRDNGMKDWGGDSNGDFVEDAVISGLVGAAGSDLRDIIVGFSKCPTDSDLAGIEAFGDTRYVGRFLTFAAMQNVPLQAIADVAKMPGGAVVYLDDTVTASLDVSRMASKVGRSIEYSPHTMDDLQNPIVDPAVSIAILDTGVDDGDGPMKHKSFRFPAVWGYDAFTGLEGNPDDDNGHGTHVAGTALGEGTGNPPFAGMCPKCSLVDVKVLGSSGSGSVSGILQAMEKVLQRAAQYRIAVVNMSLGSKQYHDGRDPLSLMANRLSDAGIVVVAAVGNSRGQGPSPDPISGPAAGDSVLAIAASNDHNTVDRTSDSIASFSSRGRRTADGDSSTWDEQKPNLTAPGVWIRAPQYNTQEGYVELNGTSMASPHVAGIAARIVQERPGIRPASVVRLLEQAAEDKGPLGWDVEWGHGLVDGGRALEAIAIPSADPGFTVHTNSGGAFWQSPDLLPDNPVIVKGVPNRIKIRVTNTSALAALAGGEADVLVGAYAFGNSDYRYDICRIPVPAVNGGQAAEVTCIWTPERDGHGCLKAEIVYALDPDHRNNRAQHNVDVKASVPGQALAYTVHVANTTGFRARIFFNVMLEFQGWRLRFLDDTGAEINRDLGFVMGPFECPRRVEVMALPQAPMGRLHAEVAVVAVPDAHVSGAPVQTLSIGGFTLESQ